MLDDLGYARKDQAETAVLFELIAERFGGADADRRLQPAVQRLGANLPDPAMTVAAIDRLVHHATILEFNAGTIEGTPPLVAEADRRVRRCRRPRNCRRASRRRHDGDMAPVDQTIIQAKVALQDIEPPIWRRLLLPPSLNLAELHHVLQAAFGWRDEHLHEFIIGGLVYGAPELADEAATEDDPRTFEATDVHLRDFDLYHVPQPEFLYHYDFGDGFGCASSPSNSGSPKTLASNTRPASTAPAIAARGVGGTSGYVRFLEAWSDPAHEEHEAMRQWAGRAFHHRQLDLQAAAKAVKTACRKARGDYASVASKPAQPATAIVANQPG